MPGPAGPSGPAGAVGPTGSAGLPGPWGVQGEVGALGVPGKYVIGPPGMNGLAGPVVITSNILSKYSRALNLSNDNIIFLFKLAVLQIKDKNFALHFFLQSIILSFV